MPSPSHPRAAFEPISPDLDLAALVESTPNFEYVVRIHCDAIAEQGIENFEKLVLLHVILGGKPLVIEGYQDRLQKWIFGLQWLKDNHGTKVENGRNLTTKTNIPLSINHYLKNMAMLTNQWNATNYKDTMRQRIYLKDIDCPPVWHDKLKDLLPPFLYYFNERTSDKASKAGDLMSSLSREMRADNMMCYIGHEGTYTPAHREMCATLGHNIMVETSTGSVEDGQPTKPGSSIWFMTETKDRHLVSEYWLSTLGHDIEIENHFAQINAWKAAPFKTYIVEQRVGDFILIPPLAPHQVWNRGTRTMKVAWNRTTVETLEMAINEALPKARMVCRDEQYKNKAIIYFSLLKYSALLNNSDGLFNHHIRQLQKDFRRLFSLYTRILLSESFSRDVSEPKNVEYLPFASNVTCSYCRCNIFNRFLTCPSCVGKLPDGDDDTYDICMECYSIGRSCACISKLQWVEQFRWKDLVRNYETWRSQILKFDKQSDPSQLPQTLSIEQENMGKKTLAEICQDELKRRPWTDITKPYVREEEEQEEVEIDDGHVRKRRKIRRSEKWKKEHKSCHICKTPEAHWKVACCSKCGLGYCYGSLFRAFEICPRTVMENPNWTCPKCLKICSCGACRRDPTMKPFEPSGTLLGHDTRKIADPRSVECLVDFSQSNLTWLKKVGDRPRRFNKKLDEAETAKSHDVTLDEQHYVDPVEAGILRLARHENIPVDPALVSNFIESSGSLPVDPAMMSGEVAVAHTHPQFAMPDNALFQEDMSDRYEATEAITFEYPDPDVTSPEASQTQGVTAMASTNVQGNGTAQQLDPNIYPGFGTDDIVDPTNDTIVQSDMASANSIKVTSRVVHEKIGSANDDEDFILRKQSHRKQSGGRPKGKSGRKRGSHRISYAELSSSEGDVPSAEPEKQSSVEVRRTRRLTRRVSSRRGHESPPPARDSSVEVIPPQPKPEPEAEPDLEPEPERSRLSRSYSHTAVEEPSRQPKPLPTTAKRGRKSPAALTTSTQPIPKPPAAQPETQPRPMTEAEINRQAKMMAMRWAEGHNSDGYVSDGWS
ncbi:JmjC domain-containing protein [Paracoccidioides lutzii Pb01]|uniref:JmjC domain-containing protein n=1 Tax=Paracoccidioides lutzii (strain ATCC MYA-826 / Pb01) TaxID=502779 RepID=C1H9P7_PARBA|nr:JmjC domain-containing protein [Paracoccidioides lutzii Pb01]EEH37070.2 JmjC domain-containing protein [Paracoccidioides lutzii Pb01]